MAAVIGGIAEDLAPGADPRLVVITMLVLKYRWETT